MGARYPDRERRQARLRQALAEILARVVDADTERVILFGSGARGDVASTSDLDLLVIRRDARRAVERVEDLYGRARPDVPVDLMVFTPEELERARQSSSFIRTALSEGELVYDRARPLA